MTDEQIEKIVQQIDGTGDRALVRAAFRAAEAASWFFEYREPSDVMGLEAAREMTDALACYEACR